MNTKQLITVLLVLMIPLTGYQATAPQRPTSKNVAQKKLSSEEIAKLLTGQDIYYDNLGLIVHKNDDGGDTAQREGWYWLGVWIRQHELHQPWTKQRKLSFPEVLRLLEPKGDGVFHRHPKYDARSLEWGLSRDQMVPLVAAMGVWGMQAELRRLWNALPQDFHGKHSFNGEWRNLLNQKKEGCEEIKKRGCDATMDCSLKQDNGDCSLKQDNGDCSLKQDNRDCPYNENTKPCEWYNKLCEIEKAADNARRKLAHDTCEAGKAAENVRLKGKHDKCEAEKVLENVRLKGEHDKCEAEKVLENVRLKGEHDTCEAEKTAKKLSCEADKATAYQLCYSTTRHSGDLIGPMTINLFRRAWGEDPMPASDLNGPSGETELLANVELRLCLATASPDSKCKALQNLSAEKGDPRENTGDDLNLIVQLLMAKLRFPSSISDEAAKLYAERRPLSFGSYLRTYYATYGDDVTDMVPRITNGIRRGWKPDADAPGPVGAVRWYHRAAASANPQLAELYEPILSYYLR